MEYAITLLIGVAFILIIFMIKLQLSLNEITHSQKILKEDLTQMERQWFASFNALKEKVFPNDDETKKD